MINFQKWMLLLIFLSYGISAAEVIKKSSSGICHNPGTSYYNRTTKYTSYSTMDECLHSGGRLPGGSHSSTNRAKAKTAIQSDGYSRDKFGKGWGKGDDPNDCMNTRHETLKRLSTSTIDTGKNKCTVERGRWFDPYTGKTFYKSSELDIDHIVPLKWEWEHGAAKWSQSKREKIANDPANLLAVEAAANRQKGAKAPWDWMPPDKAYHCQYLLRFTRVVQTYGLELSGDEKNKLKGLFKQGNCRTPLI